MIKKNSYTKRKVGDIFLQPSSGRYMIKTEEGVIYYAVYIARKHPEICGMWFEGCEVHHIDGNKINDVPENLLCLPSKVHHKLHTKKVVGYLNDVIIGVFNSLTEASKETGCPISTISYYCNHNKPQSSPYANWKWRRI